MLYATRVNSEMPCYPDISTACKDDLDQIKGIEGPAVFQALAGYRTSWRQFDDRCNTPARGGSPAMTGYVGLGWEEAICKKQYHCRFASSGAAAMALQAAYSRIEIRNNIHTSPGFQTLTAMQCASSTTNTI